jgi:hypothetical protein
LSKKKINYPKISLHIRNDTPVKLIPKKEGEVIHQQKEGEKVMNNEILEGEKTQQNKAVKVEKVEKVEKKKTEIMYT